MEQAEKINIIHGAIRNIDSDTSQATKEEYGHNAFSAEAKSFSYGYMKSNFAYILLQLGLSDNQLFLLQNLTKPN